MRKIGKISVLVIIGMLIVNLVAAMPIGDSGDAVLKTDQEKTQEIDPTIPENPTILEDPTDSEGPTVYGGSPPPGSTGFGSRGSNRCHIGNRTQLAQSPLHQYG